MAEYLQRANTLLHQSTDEEKFATLFYAVLDTREHLLCYANAGQNDPYFLPAHSSPQSLKTGGVMPGLLPRYPFQEDSVFFLPGDLLVIYSDGITEAKNALEEDFGKELLLELV